jgi:hypothetical protein
MGGTAAAAPESAVLPDAAEAAAENGERVDVIMA